MPRLQCRNEDFANLQKLRDNLTPQIQVLCFLRSTNRRQKMKFQKWGEIMFKVVTFSSCPLKRLLEVFGASGVEMLLEKFPERFPHWVRIDCTKNGQILSREEIHQKIISVLQRKKII